MLPRFAAGSTRTLSTSTRSTTTEPNAEEQQQQPASSETAESTTAKKDLELVTEMSNVAWPGLLAAMSFYLSANLDEELFQSTMRSYQNFTNVCGVLGLVVPRDAFLTNLCKNAIPANPVLSSGLLSNKNTGSTTSIATVSTSTIAVSYSELPAQQQQVLSNIVLSDKNLYSLRVLLNITMFLGGVLGPSWYLVLETLQQADFLLFNRPSPKGSGSGSASTIGVPPIRRTLSGTAQSTTSINTLTSQQSSGKK